MVTRTAVCAVLAVAPCFASEVLRIAVGASEPEPVRLAAEDLARDVERVTGRRPALVNTCKADCVAVRTGGLGALWEAWRVESAPQGVQVTGSDARGTIFGVYAFSERYLGMDPMYLWTGLKPARKSRLRLSGVRMESGEPSFRFRGWFINDEDLLTEWRESWGVRHLAYPYYHRAIPPDVAAMIYESMLRLGYNLVIPASFVDVTNPDEGRLIELAARRGLSVSMHHVEPLGVSAFGYQNYWRLRGRNVPYSFVSQSSAFSEVWRYLAAHWARYPNVVWQLGLRGIADQPVWAADPNVPASMEGRGALISKAIADQWAIVREFDRRPEPPATTTMWMEGADLHRRGHLRFPMGVAVVFADDGPGWKWREDFHETPREPGRRYGVYQHHAFWSAGPHLVQAVSPAKAQAMIGEAVKRGDRYYALLNVSNVREFALGAAASASMLRNFAAFDADGFLKAWCERRFGAAARDAESAYRGLFDGFETNARTGSAALLDGMMCAAAKRIAARRLSVKLGASPEERPRDPGLREVALRQSAKWREALAHAERARAALAGAAREFFDANCVAQIRLVLGLSQVVIALDEGADARDGMQEIREAQKLAARGEWKDWYRGDRKMRLGELEHLIEELRGSRSH